MYLNIYILTFYLHFYLYFSIFRIAPYFGDMRIEYIHTLGLLEILLIKPGFSIMFSVLCIPVTNGME